ncbi:MAG: hypothetical protein GF311_00545 [Candidatus Lokiarchaeota archaeon]|nr:hypothetical protein [Candidatus Lokiarchaeota archaeon]
MVIKIDEEKWLRKILNDQNLDKNQLNNIKNLKKSITDTLKSNYLGGNPIFYNAGSYAKGTMIKTNYDLDIVAYWSPFYNHSVSELYYNVGKLLDRNWKGVSQKTVGWQIQFRGNFHIDVIPGKLKPDKKDYAYLYNKDINGRFETSVKKQVKFIKRKRRQKTIRLLKLWKIRKNVPIKTFILELLTVFACKGIPRKNLGDQLRATFNFMKNEILRIKLFDPANSNNLVSNDLTIEQKHRIKNLADQALNAKNWHEAFFK